MDGNRHYDARSVAHTLRATARSLVDEANAADPAGRRFLVVEVTGVTAQKFATIKSIFAAQQSRIDALEAQVATLQAGQTPADVEADVDKFIADNGHLAQGAQGPPVAEVTAAEPAKPLIDQLG